MRNGVNTSTVVVGRIGTDLHTESTTIGDTINLTSRLQSRARLGSVPIIDSTHKSAAGLFETLELGELEIKGHAPVRAFHIQPLLGPNRSVRPYRAPAPVGRPVAAQCT